MATSLPVLISGAGPVGLSLALKLGRAGIDCEVFEAEPELANEFRASTLHASTLEMFEQWGVADEVIAKGLKSDKLQFWERETRKLIAEFPFSLIAEDTAFPFRLQCPQNVVTRILKPAAEATGHVRVHMSHAAERYENLGDRVRLHLQGPSGPVQVEGCYLAACDGPRSPERIQMGVEFPNHRTCPDRFLLIGTDIDLPKVYPGIGPVAYFYDPEEWVICMKLPTMLRTVFRIADEEDAEEVRTEASCRRRLAKIVGNDVQYDIKVVGLYSVHQRAADRFRDDRVILCGDAAHLNNPTGGMGLNSGVHDANMLADKLLDALSGKGEAGLDEYAEARRNYAVNKVQAGAEQNYADLVQQDADKRVARNQAMAEIASDPAKARVFLLRSAMLDARA